jgi:hypothetical protein
MRFNPHLTALNRSVQFAMNDRNKGHKPHPSMGTLEREEQSEEDQALLEIQRAIDSLPPVSEKQLLPIIEYGLTQLSDMPYCSPEKIECYAVTINKMYPMILNRAPHMADQFVKRMGKLSHHYLQQEERVLLYQQLCEGHLSQVFKDAILSPPPSPWQKVADAVASTLKKLGALT